MRGDAFTPVPNRGMITISIMLANIMQGLDNTILNVALPHIQGSLSASLDQVAWALTSYIVCSAIMMPLTGWLAGRFGIKRIFLASIIGFTIASALCGAATSLGELVAFRALQGVAGAGLIPLSQATLLQINPPERHGHAMAVFGVGTICGPIMGPALGGWLTQEHSWRWVFYINLPIGLLCTLGVLVFIRHSRNIHREPFDVVGFLALSLGIGALQLLLDRGELKDWFNSSEIWIEAAIAGLGLYLFSVHTVTTDGPSFLNRDLLKSTNYTAGTVLMFAGGLIMTGTLALLSTMLQNLMAYPAMTTGFVTMPRGLAHQPLPRPGSRQHAGGHPKPHPRRAGEVGIHPKRLSRARPPARRVPGLFCLSRRGDGEAGEPDQGRARDDVVATSSSNQCQYCVVAHGAILPDPG